MLENHLFEAGPERNLWGQKISLEGALSIPSAHTKNQGILFISGFNSDWEIYKQFLLDPLSKSFPIAAIELRNQGWGFNAGALADDLVAVDRQVRENLGVESLHYLGHSMGHLIGKEASRRHAKKISSFIGMASYPSTEAIIPYLGKIGRLHPIGAYPLLPSSQDTVITMICGEQDWIAGTSFPKVRERFAKELESYPHSSLRYIKGNHWFNDGMEMVPVNKRRPDLLLSEIYLHLEKNR